MENEADKPKTYTIKLLEWRQSCNSPYIYITETPFNVYYVGVNIKEAWYRVSDTCLEMYPTLEAAKQAAQSHWEERLKGALQECVNGKYEDLYQKVNIMMNSLGMHGEITSRDEAVEDVMNVLHEIDGGSPSKETPNDTDT